MNVDNWVCCVERLKRDGKEMVGEECMWQRIVVRWVGRLKWNCVYSRNVRQSDNRGYLTLCELKMW